ncbi:MAG TPA: SxtJ family membrane protein [Schlesneria sp.]|jgi:hypothetical protein
MAVIEINWKPSNRDLRLFAVVQLVVMATAAWLLHRRYGRDAMAVGLLVASLATLFIGMVTPPLMRPLFLMWMIAAFPVGWVMSHVVLAVVYFGVVTPIAFALRLAGRDTLQRKLRPEATTYWIPRSGAPEPSRYFRQF